MKKGIRTFSIILCMVMLFTIYPWQTIFVRAEEVIDAKVGEKEKIVLDSFRFKKTAYCVKFSPAYTVGEYVKKITSEFSGMYADSEYYEIGEDATVFCFDRGKWINLNKVNPDARIEVGKKYKLRFEIVFDADCYSPVSEAKEAEVIINEIAVQDAVVEPIDNEKCAVTIPVEVDESVVARDFYCDNNSYYLKKGISLQINAYFGHSYNLPDIGIDFYLSGNNSQDTYITEDGLLHVAEDESSDCLYLKMVTRYDIIGYWYENFYIVDDLTIDSIDFISNIDEVCRGEINYLTFHAEGTADNTCKVEVSGLNSPDSKIIHDGANGDLQVYVAENETAKQITVKITSVADASKAVSKIFNVVNKVTEDQVNISYDESILNLKDNITYAELLNAINDNSVIKISPYNDYSMNYSVEEVGIYYKDEKGNNKYLSYEGYNNVNTAIPRDKEYYYYMTVTTKNRFVTFSDNVNVLINGKSVNEAGMSLTVADDTKLMLQRNLFNPTHEHSVQYVPGKAATCKGPGYRECYKCSCGLLFEDEAATKLISSWDYWEYNVGYLSSTSHIPEDEYSMDSTFHTKKCKYCERIIEQKTHLSNMPLNETYDEYCVKCGYLIRPAEDHTFSEEFFYDGVGHWHECTKCGTEDEKVEHRSNEPENPEDAKICLDCGYIITAEAGHEHDLIKVPGKEATCIKKGYADYYECSTCKHRYEDDQCQKEILDFKEWQSKSIVPAKGHTETIIPGKAATCVSTGLTDGLKCSVCDEIIVYQDDIDMVDHTWDAGTVSKEATTEAEGTKTYTCIVCKATRSEVIPKLKKEASDKDSESEKDEQQKDDKDKTDEKIDQETPAPSNNVEIAAKGKINAKALISEKIKGTDKEGIKIDKYVTSDKTIATVNKKGVVVGKKEGTVTITAQHKVKKGEYEDITSITVAIKVPKLPELTEINYLDTKIDFGKALTNAPIDQKISWAVSSKKISDIDPVTGVLTPKKNGKVLVKCKIGDGKNAATITAKVNVKIIALSLKDGAKIKANKKPKTVILKNVPEGGKVTWTVDKDGILGISETDVDSKIKIKGLAQGEAKLKASYDGRDYEITVNVK